jgi:hypothetical protein
MDLCHRSAATSLFDHYPAPWDINWGPLNILPWTLCFGPRSLLLSLLEINSSCRRELSVLGAIVPSVKCTSTPAGAFHYKARAQSCVEAMNSEFRMLVWGPSR